MSRITAAYIVEQAYKSNNQPILNEGIGILGAIKLYFSYQNIKLFVESTLPRLNEVIPVVESAAALEKDIDKEAIKASAARGSSVILDKINQTLENKLSFWTAENSKTLESLVGFLGKVGLLTVEKINVNNLLQVLKRINFVYQDFVKKTPGKEKLISKLTGGKSFSHFEFFALLIEIFRGTVTNKDAIDVLIQDKEVKKILADLPSTPPEQSPPSTLEENQILRFKQLAGIINE